MKKGNRQQSMDLLKKLYDALPPYQIPNHPEESAGLLERYVLNYTQEELNKDDISVKKESGVR